MISKLAQYLIEKGVNSNIPFEIGKQNMGTEWEGKQIGALNDFLNKKTSKIKRLIKNNL